MQAQEIETYLAELGQELQNLGVQRPIRILQINNVDDTLNEFFP